MPPCMPHYMITADNSVCHGAHFLSASTMTSTCFGILHTFTHHLRITNQDDIHHRVTLARIIYSWKDTLVGSDFCDKDVKFVADVPNLWMMSGLIDLLSTYNIIHLGSLLWEEQYRLKAVDRKLLALYEEAQIAADELLQWLKDTIDVVIILPDGKAKDLV